MVDDRLSTPGPSRIHSESCAPSAKPLESKLTAADFGWDDDEINEAGIKTEFDNADDSTVISSVFDSVETESAATTLDWDASEPIDDVIRAENEPGADVCHQFFLSGGKCLGLN